MLDGLYKVEFETPLGSGSGVVTLAGGRLTGGDSAIYYVGNYKDEGGRFSAHVQTGRHTVDPQIISVFGVDSVTIELAGTVAGSTVTAKGKSPQAPGLAFDAVLTKLA